MDFQSHGCRSNVHVGDYMQLKYKLIKTIPIILIVMILITPVVSATEYTLVDDGRGMVAHDEKYVEDHFTDLDDADDLDDFRKLYEDTLYYWDEGEAKTKPKGADIDKVKMEVKSSNSYLRVFYHDKITSIDGYIMLIGWFDGKFAIHALTNGTDITATGVNSKLNDTDVSGSVNDEKVTIEIDNDDYKYKNGDDFYIISIFIEMANWSESPDEYIFDVVPKLNNMLSMFGAFFSNPENLILLVVFAVAIVVIIWYARKNALIG